MDYIKKEIQCCENTCFYKLLSDLVTAVENNDFIIEKLIANHDKILYDSFTLIPIILPLMFHYKRTDASEWVISNIDFSRNTGRSVLYASMLALGLSTDLLPESWVKKRDVLHKLLGNPVLTEKYHSIVGDEYFLAELIKEYGFPMLSPDTLTWITENLKPERQQLLRCISIDVNSDDVRGCIDHLSPLTYDEVDMMVDNEYHPYILDRLLEELQNESEKKELLEDLYQAMIINCNTEGSKDIIRVYHIAHRLGLAYKDIKRDVYDKDWYETVRESRKEYKKFIEIFEEGVDPMQD